MKFRSIHKYPPDNVGDSVRVTLPDVDRGRADPRNILFAVVAIENEQYYKLGNKYGTLPQLYTRNQFGRVLGYFLRIQLIINIKDINFHFFYLLTYFILLI